MTRHLAWTLAITAAAIFMVTLDNLVVTTALPVLREDLGASLADLEWTVNAYTLSFAVSFSPVPRSAIDSAAGAPSQRASGSSRLRPPARRWLRRSRSSSPPAAFKGSERPWSLPSP